MSTVIIISIINTEKYYNFFIKKTLALTEALSTSIGVNVFHFSVEVVMYRLRLIEHKLLFFFVYVENVENRTSQAKKIEI